MVFNSIEFLLFAVLFFALWPLFRAKNQLRWAFITLASLFFYGWWDWRFLFLIIGSGLIDYLCGIGIATKPTFKKTFLYLSIVANIGCLSVFKYSVFFATVFQDFFLLFDLQLNLTEQIPDFTLILPIGISFYTFQSMSYTIDIYRGKLHPTYNLAQFFAYLAMFPQLVAGPIVRARHLLKQLESYKVPNSIEKWHAIKLITFGLFQKMVIADNLARLVDAAYNNKTIYDGSLFWWVTVLAFSFQIYTDFSGYSLIARGIAKYMGYHFRMNFNHPYLSAGFRDFWQRWHISLSTWFRDYVYIPLGGSRQGIIKAAITLFITMLISGLWHGANYTFICWAFLHALFLLIERFTQWPKRLNMEVVSISITFLFVTVAWVYFRSSTLDQAHGVLFTLFSFQTSDLDFLKIFINPIFFLSLVGIIELGIYLRKNNSFVRQLYSKCNLDVYSVIFCILTIVFFRGAGHNFIYFQF